MQDDDELFFDQHLSFLESTLGIQNEEGEEVGVGVTPAISRRDGDNSENKIPKSSGLNPNVHPITIGATCSEDINENSVLSPHSNLDTIASDVEFQFRNLDINSDAQQDDRIKVNGCRTSMEILESPKSYSDRPPLAQARLEIAQNRVKAQPQSQPEESTLGSTHSSNSDSTHLTTESSARRQLKARKKEKVLMKSALRSLAKATIYQVRRHQSYKRKYVGSKRELEDSSQKVTQTLAEKHDFRNSFYQTRAKFLMEQDVREELSYEVQTLAAKLNHLRRDRSADEELKQRILDELDDDNESDLSFSSHSNSNAMGMPSPITSSLSPTNISPLRCPPSKLQDRPQAQLQPRHSVFNIKKVRFADETFTEVGHNAPLAIIKEEERDFGPLVSWSKRSADSPASEPPSDDVNLPVPMSMDVFRNTETATLDSMSSRDLLCPASSSSSDDGDDGPDSFTAVKVALELEILNLKSKLQKREDRMERLEDRATYLEGKPQVARGYLKGNISTHAGNDILVPVQSANLQAVSMTTFDAAKEVIEEVDEDKEAEMY